MNFVCRHCGPVEGEGLDYCPRCTQRGDEGPRRLEREEDVDVMQAVEETTWAL